MIYIFDCEVFAYDWLFVFMHRETGEYTVIHNDNDAIKQFMDQDPILCGFNNKHYDNHILKAILCDADPVMVKSINDFIIVHGHNGWENPFLQQYKVFFDSFDLMVQAVMQHQAAGIIPGLFALCAPVPGMAELRYIPLQNTEYENRMFLCLLTCKDRELRYQETILLTCIREFFQKLLDQTNPRDHLGEEEAQ